MKNIKLLVAAGLAIAVFLPAVSSAQTVADLQAQIQALLAQLQQLQAQLAQVQGGAAWCHTFNTNLGIGSSGNEVSALLDVLSKEGVAGVAAQRSSDFASTFDEVFASAVSAFQEKYRSEILTPAGLTSPTGYVGARTRAKLNALYKCEPPIIIPELPPITRPVSVITVLSPNGGEQWALGSNQTIQWSSDPFAAGSALEGVAFVDIDLLSWSAPCAKGDLCALAPSFSVALARKAQNTGSYQWFVGKSLSGSVIPAGLYVIRISNSGNLSQYDQSDAAFSIVKEDRGNLPPVISGVSGPTVLNVGETGKWEVRASDPEQGPLTYSVIWGDEGIVGIAERAVSSAPGAVTQTATFTHIYSRAGTYAPTFTVTDNGGLSAKASVSVSVTGGIITQPPIVFSINVLSPNGGETWVQGSTRAIKWESAAAGSAVNITITNYLSCWFTTPACLPPVMQRVIASNVSNTGSYNWVVPADLSGQYKITVSDAGGSGVTDSSDAPFTIASSPTVITQPSISSLTPSSGSVGASVLVTGSGFSTESGGNAVKFGSGYVKGLTSLDGQTLKFIVPSGLDLCPPTFGKDAPQYCALGFPQVTPGTYAVAVMTKNGTSNSVNFTVISPPTSASLTVTAPNGGETWTKGTTQTIKWQDSTAVPPCPVGAYCALSLTLYDITLVPYYLPCTEAICPAYPFTAPYTIAKGVYGSSYSWSVGKILDIYGTGAAAPDGSYTIQVCQSGSATCDSSDSYFKIVSQPTVNQPPVIDNVTWPLKLTVGQAHTWSGTVYDSDGSVTGVLVSWGDGSANQNTAFPLGAGAVPNKFSFTHSYNRGGIYNVVITATDDKGGTRTAQSEVTVVDSALIMPTTEPTGQVYSLNQMAFILESARKTLMEIQALLSR